MNDDAHARPDDAEAPGERPPSLEESLRQVGQAGRAGFDAVIDTGRALRGLVVADIALARVALARAAAWMAVAVVFGASSWLLLMGALIALLQRLGLSWLAALSIAAGLSVAITALGVWQTLRYFEFTRLEATRRQLRKLGIGSDEDEAPAQDATP